MATLKISTNDDLVICTLGGNDYIAVLNTPSSPYTLFPGANTVTPGVELWSCTGDEDVSINDTIYIRDNSNVHIVRINGPRPRNVVRR